MTNNTPKNFSAGESLSFTVSHSDYQPGDGWSLLFVLRGANQLDIAATVSDSSTFLISASVIQTSSLSPGAYFYSLVVTKDTARHVIASGQINVTVNLEALSVTYDGRSSYKVIIDTIDAVIQGRADKVQSSYTIGNRQIAFIPYEELIKLRSYYAGLEAKRLARETPRTGVFKTIKTEFVRA